MSSWSFCAAYLLVKSSFLGLLQDLFIRVCFWYWDYWDIFQVNLGLQITQAADNIARLVILSLLSYATVPYNSVLCHIIAHTMVCTYVIPRGTRVACGDIRIGTQYTLYCTSYILDCLSQRLFSLILDSFRIKSLLLLFF